MKNVIEKYFPWTLNHLQGRSWRHFAISLGNTEINQNLLSFVSFTGWFNNLTVKFPKGFNLQTENKKQLEMFFECSTVASKILAHVFPFHKKHPTDSSRMFTCSLQCIFILISVHDVIVHERCDLLQFLLSRDEIYWFLFLKLSKMLSKQFLQPKNHKVIFCKEFRKIGRFLIRHEMKIFQQFKLWDNLFIKIWDLKFSSNLSRIWSCSKHKSRDPSHHFYLPTTCFKNRFLICRGVFFSRKINEYFKVNNFPLYCIARMVSFLFARWSWNWMILNNMTLIKFWRLNTFKCLSK